MIDEYEPYDWEEERPVDQAQGRAYEKLRAFFVEHSDEVFFKRQLEVLHEDEFFHWVTSRALKDLVDERLVLMETRQLSTGGVINLYWHRGYRYYRRSASAVVELVEEYADPNIGAALGLHGEMMVLEGFARKQFVLVGRETREYRGRVWTQTEHDLDFIFEKNGIGYGIEVKNTLPYIDYDEFQTKIALCEYLRLQPVFVVRMMPRIWIYELRNRGGFTLVLKYQLYPWTHRELARKVAERLKLPVDAPRALAEGTMARFARWHEERL